MNGLHVSPASDHAICAAYADCLGKFAWSNSYAGARGELAAARQFSRDVYVDTLAHLARVRAPNNGDYKLDIKVAGLVIDVKTSRPTSSGRASGLIVNTLHPDVIYLLMRCQSAFPTRDSVPVDLEFEIGGWRHGGDPIWRPCPFDGRVHGKPWVDGDQLRPFDELLRMAREGLTGADVA